MKVTSSRAAAYDVLLRIETNGEFSSSLLPFYQRDLDEKDAGLCQELVLGVLRNQMLLDWSVDEFARGKKLDIEVRIACRLGLYQLWFLDRVPAYSAVNEAVSLVVRAKKTSAKGFVNALLRRAKTSPDTSAITDPLAKASVETSHPQWLIERWTKQFGPDDARIIAASNNEQIPHAFRTTLRTSDETLRQISELPRSEFVEGCYFAPASGRKFLDLAQEGQIYFQDEASQMVGASITAQDGSRILDVCAAPGGKTAQIARSNPGCTVIAADRSSKRLEFMRENLLAQGAGSVLFVQLDAEFELPFGNEKFETVFVDAPCSGTGTIRHNPELRYLITEADIVLGTRKQLAILNSASKCVMQGGELVYSTCSLETDENEYVVAAFLKENDDFSILRVSLPGRFISSEGFGRTFPHRDKMDGFFIARLRRG